MPRTNGETLLWHRKGLLNGRVSEEKFKSEAIKFFGIAQEESCKSKQYFKKDIEDFITKHPNLQKNMLREFLEEKGGIGKNHETPPEDFMTEVQDAKQRRLALSVIKASLNSFFFSHREGLCTIFQFGFCFSILQRRFLFQTLLCKAERCLLFSHIFSHHCDNARCCSCLLPCFPQHWRTDLLIRMRLFFRFRLLINKKSLHNIWLGLLKDALFVENGIIFSILFYRSRFLTNKQGLDTIRMWLPSTWRSPLLVGDLHRASF